MCAARFNVSVKDSFSGDWQFSEPQKRGVSLNAVTNSSSNNLQRRQQFQQPSFNQGLNYNSNKGYQPNMQQQQQQPRDYQAAEREAQQFLGKQNQWDVRDTKHSALSLLEEFEQNAKRPNYNLPSSQNPLQALQQQQQLLYQQLPSQQQEGYQQGNSYQQQQQQPPPYYPQQQYNNKALANAEVPILLSKLEEQNIALMNLISEVANKSEKRNSKKNRNNKNNDSDDNDSEEDDKDYRHKKRGNNTNKQHHRKQQQQDRGEGGTQELARRVAQLEAKLVLNNGNSTQANLNYPNNQGQQSYNNLKNGMENSNPANNEQSREQGRNSNQNLIFNQDKNNNNYPQPYQQQNMSNFPVPFSQSLPLNQMNFQQPPTQQQVPSNGYTNTAGFNSMNQLGIGNPSNPNSQSSLNDESFQSTRENQPRRTAQQQQQKQPQVKNNDLIQQRTNTGDTNNNVNSNNYQKNGFSNDLFALNQFSAFQANRNIPGWQKSNNNKGEQTIEMVSAPVGVARTRGGTGGITTAGQQMESIGEREEFKFKLNPENTSNNRRTQTGAKEDVYDALERYAKSKEDDIKQERLKSQQQQSLQKQGLDGKGEKNSQNNQRILNSIDLDESYLGVVPQRPQLIDNSRIGGRTNNLQEDLVESQPLPMQFKLMAKQQNNNTSLWKDGFTPDQNVLADIFRAQNLNSAARPV